MSKRSRIIMLSTLLCLAVVLMFVFFSRERDNPEPLEGDPLRERGMRAAAIGGELAAVVRGQLEALPDEHREEVGALLLGLEERVAVVKKVLSRKDADEEELASAVASLEELLNGILVVPNNEMIKKEGSVNS